MKHFFIPRLNLQLFAEGGAPAGDGGSEGTGVSAPAAGVQTKGAKGNPYANVVFGKQKEGAPAAEVQKTDPQKEPAAPDRDAEFQNLIKGDYKDSFQKHLQSILQPRLKGANEIKQKYEAMSPLTDIIASRYGLQPDDVQGMIKALENDESYFERVAAEKNTDVDVLKRQERLELENSRLKRSSDEQFRQQQLNQRFAVWEQQAEAAKVKYPNLDLKEELKNTDFCKLLDSGVDVASAYLVLHQDDIMAGAMQYTAQTVKQKVANDIAAGNKRPAENGTSGQSGVTIKSDPSKWTKAEREHVRREVARGKKVYL